MAHFFKCSALYFQMKVACFVRQKEKTDENFRQSFTLSKKSLWKLRFTRLIFISRRVYSGCDDLFFGRGY